MCSACHEFRLIYLLCVRTQSISGSVQTLIQGLLHLCAQGQYCVWHDPVETKLWATHASLCTDGWLLLHWRRRILLCWRGCHVIQHTHCSLFHPCKRSPCLTCVMNSPKVKTDSTVLSQQILEILPQISLMTTSKWNAKLATSTFLFSCEAQDSCSSSARMHT